MAGAVDSHTYTGGRDSLDAADIGFLRMSRPLLVLEGSHMERQSPLAYKIACSWLRRELPGVLLLRIYAMCKSGVAATPWLDLLYNYFGLAVSVSNVIPKRYYESKRSCWYIY